MFDDLPALCPFNGKSCTKKRCEWWIDNSGKCAVVLIAESTQKKD